MDNGGKPWHLGDRGTKQVDAALIVKAGCIPATATRLHVQTCLRMEEPSLFEVHKQKALESRSHTRFHIDILGGYFSNASLHGQIWPPRDSGALVSEARTGRGVGVYIGRDPVPRSVAELQCGRHIAISYPSTVQPTYRSLYLRWRRMNGEECKRQK